MHRAHANGFSYADALMGGCARLGHPIHPNSRILDFGCGTGKLVYELRDRGYDACGFDLMNTAVLREPTDAAYFSFLEERSNPSDTRITDENFRLPYPDASFDIISSDAVLEHCFSLNGAMRECARVLKPTGAAVHSFPSRNQLIEPHILVPFGGRINGNWWLRLWANLGVRNHDQTDRDVDDIVHRNRHYMDIGVCYRSRRQILKTARKYFTSASFVTTQYAPHDTFRSRIARYRQALRDDNVLAKLAQVPSQLVLVTR